MMCIQRVPYRTVQRYRAVCVENTAGRGACRYRRVISVSLSSFAESADRNVRLLFLHVHGRVYTVFHLSSSFLPCKSACEALGSPRPTNTGKALLQHLSSCLTTPPLRPEPRCARWPPLHMLLEAPPPPQLGGSSRSIAAVP